MFILRESCEYGQLPDEIIQEILKNVSTLQLIAFGWDSVSRGFRLLIHRILSKRSQFDTTCQENWPFFSAFSAGNDVWLHSKLLFLVAFKHFHNLKELCIDAATLRNVSGVFSLNSLHSFRVKIGGIYGGKKFGGSQFYQKFVNNCLSSVSLSHISIEVTLTSGDDCSSVEQFRDLVRSLSTKTTPQATWDLCFLDETKEGQKWLSPVQLCTHGDECVVSYVRVMQFLEIPIHRIKILDGHKISPYMLIGSITKRRSLYMWHEYKECEFLSIDYDIGMVSSNFGIGIHSFPNLKNLELQSSHVLYKKDFLEYLTNAPNLNSLCVVAPTSFPRRVSQCKAGCFLSPDYACFRPDGWCQR